jgi:hypothetical protein
MKKLQVIQKKIIQGISNTSNHIALDVRILTEEIESASTVLYQRIRQHDNPIIAAPGNYDIHMHSRPKQTLH